MTVPGSNVVPWLRKATSCGTEKIMSEVLESCMISPLTRVLMLKSSGE
eukprot:CAMPEP_0175890600 /NCGR_PEP_ID=MMETSP0107_2-20121207/47899_1 /TAXON_ID=195067 ORGANISM="Goniomonas pacifica, Strain CCMP1869" /NCGR_SAMPLE_ID=MMETSP0107_2 /ASSEMBLY_ACC=CAM_ASM_000203 /LENGTH=47 /DNA_ID= /DNA_START= /DNA_END= /DNA_ORIENTATION=